MDSLNLPAAYVPVTNLKIGDIIACDAQALVTVGGSPPMIIGDGDVLRIWLSVPSEKPDDPWRELIVDNVSSLADLVVDANEKLLRVRLGKVTLLSAFRKVGDRLDIAVLELRPLGLTIFKDKAGLHILGSTLTMAEFHGVPVIVACPATS